MIPHFFIVGAPKAGTTSLYEYLSSSEDIFTPAIKEPHHFSCPEVTDTYYNVEFINDRDEYVRLYADVRSGQLAGDFSPSYLFSESAAYRIHKARPDAKIIIVLRNPIDRAVSHYLMDVRHGYQELELADCLVDTPDTRQFFKEYVSVGRYLEQVQRYQDLFPSEQIRVVLYDDLVKSTEATVQSMLAFLGLKPEFDDPGTRHNFHKTFRSPIVGRILQNQLVRYLGAAVPRGLKNRLVDSLSTTKKPNFVDERKLLANIFEAELQPLAKLIGRDLSTWSATRNKDC